MSAQPTPLQALEALVLALGRTNWSTWQTTATFDPHLQAAEQLVEAERARAAGVELLTALSDILGATFEDGDGYVCDISDFLPPELITAARAAVFKATAVDATSQGARQ